MGNGERGPLVDEVGQGAGVEGEEDVFAGSGDGGNVRQLRASLRQDQRQLRKINLQAVEVAAGNHGRLQQHGNAEFGGLGEQRLHARVGKPQAEAVGMQVGAAEGVGGDGELDFAEALGDVERIVAGKADEARR